MARAADRPMGYEAYMPLICQLLGPMIVDDDELLNDAGAARCW